MAVRSAGVLAILLIVLNATGGCRRNDEEGLQTYKVEGRVVHKGGQPFTGGLVEFQTNDASQTAIGEIQSDGSFALRTLREQKRVPGAAQGDYRVTVIPPMAEDQSGQPITLPRRYRIEPKDNYFTLEITPSRR
jgi:hypothetical protein